jgi:glycosyltransferase 2 family protein
MRAVVVVPIPLGPTTLLESAIKFINISVPSSAGKIALNIRYLQRQGADAASAVTQGALDGVAGFIIQALLIVILLPTADFDFDTDGDSSTSHLLVIGVLVIVVVIVAIGVVACVGSLRRRVMPFVTSARTSLGTVARSPGRAVQLLSANFGSQLCYALCLGASLRAFSSHTSIANLLLINTGVSLFAGLMPIPGGIGVAEAGLIAGLTAVGIPPDIAFATAITHRVATYYLPPAPGYVSLRWLRRHDYV